MMDPGANHLPTDLEKVLDSEIKYAAWLQFWDSYFTSNPQGMAFP